MMCNLCQGKGVIGSIGIGPSEMLCPGCKTSEVIPLKRLGTPKTLDEAIERGLADGNVKGHVEDFIRNKLGIVMMSDQWNYEWATAKRLQEYLLGGVKDVKKAA